ncbi:MAG TPA: hypothetical protein VLS49_10305 [Usitatibacter sp.]|nr:hypothetical protein [Usitatibacter sp.]
MKVAIALVSLAASLGPLGAAAQDGPPAIGEPREAAGLESAAGVSAALRWADLPGGGHLAALRITSSGARGLRAGIRVGGIPRDAILRFYAPGEAGSRDVPAATVLDALARNRDAGESGPDARTWWSPVVAGDTLILEIELAPGAAPASLAIAVPSVSHLREWPGSGDAQEGDATHAVALVTSGGATRACEGTLVASPLRSSRRYFLAESRCVSTQSEASSLQAFWPRGASGVGARLLYVSADTDTAFLALDSPPPVEVPVSAAALERLDPALEQWLGRAAASRASGPPGTFSSP